MNPLAFVFCLQRSFSCDEFCFTFASIRRNYRIHFGAVSAVQYPRLMIRESDVRQIVYERLRFPARISEI